MRLCLLRRPSPRHSLRSKQLRAKLEQYYNNVGPFPSAGVNDPVNGPDYLSDCAGTFPYVCISEEITQPLTAQTKDYTCAPASTVNVLWAVTGHQFAESQIESEEKTQSSNGTVFANIPPVLNKHQSRFAYGGSETIAQAPQGDAAYMAYLLHSVRKGTSIMNNVQTSYLASWHGHEAHHYDVSYGESVWGVGVKLAEQYDPTRFGYSLSHYGGVNPYGYHLEDTNNVVNAVFHSVNQRVIFA